MSTELGTETVTLSTTRRTWRTNIESPEGGDVVITAFRETVKRAGTAVLSREQPGHADKAERTLSAVAAEQVTLADGTALTAAQVGEAVTLFLEKWDAEDRAAAAAAAAATP